MNRLLDAWMRRGAGGSAPDARGFGADDGRDIDDPTTTFAELLSCLRLAAGVSQRALGWAIGVRAGSIERLEQGERPPPAQEVVIALAAALRATPTERDHLIRTAESVQVGLQVGSERSALAKARQELTHDSNLGRPRPPRRRMRARSRAKAERRYGDRAFEDRRGESPPLNCQSPRRWGRR